MPLAAQPTPSPATAARVTYLGEAEVVLPTSA